MSVPLFCPLFPSPSYNNGRLEEPSVSPWRKHKCTPRYSRKSPAATSSHLLITFTETRRYWRNNGDCETSVGLGMERLCRLCVAFPIHSLPTCSSYSIPSHLQSATAVRGVVAQAPHPTYPRRRVSRGYFRSSCPSKARL